MKQGSVALAELCCLGGRRYHDPLRLPLDDPATSRFCRL